MSKVQIGIYGGNGHQIYGLLDGHPHAEIVAGAGFGNIIPEPVQKSGIKLYETLDELLAHPGIQLISLCSPMRSEQGGHAVRCLEAGKHVYTEKPSAMTVAEIDRIAETASRTGMIFHEQACTAFHQPYLKMSQIVRSGVLGEVVQVYGQKAYPWGDWRPQDENVDGGLGTQAGVYCARFVEHVAGVRIKSLIMQDTKLGNDVPGGECRRAVSMMMELQNGGLASGIANYLGIRPPDWYNWGYEIVRIFGTKGFLESLDCGRIGTLALVGHKPETIDYKSEPDQDYLSMFIDEIRTGKKVIPLTLEEELSPVRWVVGAREKLRKGN